MTRISSLFPERISLFPEGEITSGKREIHSGKATEFTMPKLGHVMEEGTVVSWKKRVGDRIEKGEVLLEIETDKAAIEIDSEISGVVLEIIVKEGETVAVGVPLMLYEKDIEE